MLAGLEKKLIPNGRVLLSDNRPWPVVFAYYQTIMPAQLVFIPVINIYRLVAVSIFGKIILVMMAMNQIFNQIS